METEKFVYIFEFKGDSSADEALQQIEDKRYAAPYPAGVFFCPFIVADANEHDLPAVPFKDRGIGFFFEGMFL